MAIVVVGGHSRNVGKTSVAAGLIAALREWKWTAVKITQYGHGICSADGAACECATDNHSWAISEERDRSGESDTSRFLLVGAKQSFWVRTRQGRLAEAMPALRQRLIGNVMIESNSVMKFLQPDLYLTVLDPAVADFKQSALEFLDRADAVLVHDSEKFAWSGVSRRLIEGKPVFRVAAPDYVTKEVVEFVQKLLVGSCY
jgi:hypothetical protein